MWQKISFVAALFTALMMFGCSDTPVAPKLGPSGAVSGETEFIQYTDLGNSSLPGGTKSQVQNQVAVFRDRSDNPQLNGLRDVLVTYNSQGKSSGTFSMVTNDVHWEGTWTGTTTSSGTTIKATGYDLNERGKSCVWYYYLPSSQDGTSGTFTARINYERD